MPLMTVEAAANNIINLVGSVEGVLVAFPAVNADGTANQPAQDAAISSMVASLVASGLFQLPDGTTLDKIQAFAPMLINIISAYKTATTVAPKPVTPPLAK